MLLDFLQDLVVLEFQWLLLLQLDLVLLENQLDLVLPENQQDLGLLEFLLQFHL